MDPERRQRGKVRIPTDNGRIILNTLATRGSSVKAWSEDSGLGTTYQRTVDNIIYGKTNGRNNTKSASGGAVRAIMLAMTKDFGVSWNWTDNLTEKELSFYKKVLADICSRTRIRVKKFHSVLKFEDHAALLKKLRDLKRHLLAPKPRNKEYIKATYFTTCVYYELCPVCFKEANVASVVLATNKDTGESIRTKNTLTCINNGCNSGLPIDTYNLLEVIVPAHT